MTVSPRSHLASVGTVLHGSIGDVELATLGLTAAEVIDFSVNTNPLGPSPAAVEAARGVEWARYPDDTAGTLRRELATREEVAEADVVVGNGSAELIWLIALAYLDPGDVAVVVGPTFGEYGRAVRVVGGVVHEYRSSPTTDFSVDLSAVIELVRFTRSRILFICNPNNPTGSLMSLAAIQSLAMTLSDTLVVVDEAYRQFVDNPEPTVSLLDLGNVVLLRSLTKDYALAGLRLGYALAPESIRTALDRVRPPWNVNAVAQVVGLAALRDEAHLERSRDEVRRAGAYLTAALAALQLRVIPSAANFFLVEVGEARAARDALLRRGMCVRDCTSFGLPGFIRIGLRSVPDCERLVKAFAAAGNRSLAGKA